MPDTRTDGFTAAASLESTDIFYALRDPAGTPLDREIPATLILGRPANRQTSNYTLVLADFGKTVEFNKATAGTVTVPPDSSVAFPTETTLPVCNYGAGVCTVTPGSGVTVRSAYGLTLPQYACGRLRKIATDEWWWDGSLPGGYELGVAVADADQTINSTSATDLSLDVTFMSDGAPVWVDLYVPGSAATRDNFILQLWDGAVGSGTNIGFHLDALGAGAATARARWRVASPTVGSRTWRASMQCHTNAANTFVRDDDLGFGLNDRSYLLITKA